MGFADRLGQTVASMGGAAWASLGQAVDFATAPWETDEEFDGFIDAAKSHAAVTLGLVAGGADWLLGPTDEAVALGFRKAMEGAEYAYREGVSEPGATVLGVLRESDTAAFQAGQRGGNFLDRTRAAWRTFLDNEVYEQAEAEAETTSIGQAFIYWFGNANAIEASYAGGPGLVHPVTGQPILTGGDPRYLTPEGREELLADGGFRFASGVADAVSRWFLDPTVVGGKLASAYRVSRVVRPLNETTDLGKVLDSTPTRRFLDEIAKRGTEEGRLNWLLRNKVIRDSQDGGATALLLARAPTDAARRDVLKVAMNRDAAAMANLTRQQGDLAWAVANLSDVKIPMAASAVRFRGGAAWSEARYKRTLDSLEDELSSLKDVKAHMDLVARSAGRVTTAPRIALGQRVSEATRWGVYQPHQFNIPMRIIKSATSMRPGVVDLNRPEGWQHLQRMVDRAPLDVATKGTILARYTAAGSEAAKEDAIRYAEREVMAAIGDKHGLSGEAVQAAVEEGWKRRDEMMSVVRERAYTGAKRTDPDGKVRYIDYIDADGVPTHRAAMDTPQLANEMPLLDVDAMDRILRRYKALIRLDEGGFVNSVKGIRGTRAAEQTSAVSEQMASIAINVWKPAQLLRLGWPIRVVTDETLRIMSIVGVVSHLPVATTSASRAVKRAAVRKVTRIEQKIDRTERRLARERARPDGDAALVSRLERSRDTLRERARKLDDSVPVFGVGPLEVGPYTLADAYGAAGEPNVYRSLASSRRTIERMFSDSGRWESHARLGTAPGNLLPNQPGYAAAWERAVNSQIPASPMARKLLDGESDDAVVAWLRHNPEGIKHRARMNMRGRDPRRWTEELRVHIDHYLPTPELKQLALARRAKHRDLQRAVPTLAERPETHATAIDMALGTNHVGQAYRKTVDFMYQRLGSAPTDVLSRHPFFVQVYRSRVRELVRQAEPDGAGRLSVAQLDDLAERAREHALSQVRKVLYEISEESNLAHTLRFVAPFYAAWQETLTRWLSLIVDDPSRLAHGVQLWNAPDAAGITEERDGAENIIAPMPEWAMRNIPGAAAIGSTGIGKESLNLAMAGEPWWLPGFGPLVQVPVAAIARGRPDLEESLKLILPYGPGENMWDQLLPAWGKRARTKAEGEDNRQYANSQVRRILELETDRRLGKHDLSDEEMYALAKEQTDAFWNLRTVANLTLPFSPWFRSPYQFYIDRYREYRDEYGPEDAEARFRADYGEEYFALTQSLSRSVNSIAPTVEGYEASKKYADLLAKHPELGSWIVGDEDTGTFAGAVYDYQFRERVGPGSAQRQRETTDPRGAMELLQRKEGWIEYGKFNDLTDAALFSRGLTSYQQTGAEDLQKLRRQVIETMRRERPEWAKDYDEFDRGKSARTAKAIASMVDDPRFADRPGTDTLKDYLELREMMVLALRAREAQGGSRNMEAKSNDDLELAWTTAVGAMRERDLDFASQWARWFSADTLRTGE